MMTSRRDSSGPRPLKRGKKQNPMQQYVMIGGVFVVLIVAVVLLTSRKPAPAPAKTAKAAAGETDEARPRRSVAARPSRDAVKAQKDQVREERRRERETRSTTRRSDDRAGTVRESRGTARSTGGARTSNPYQLKAILVDESGQRYALVGDRRFKNGDDVGGRKLVEIDADGVKVNNGVSVYSVKVGQAIY